MRFDRLKKLSFSCALGGAVLALAACGGSDDGAGSDAAAPSAVDATGGAQPDAASTATQAGEGAAASADAAEPAKTDGATPAASATATAAATGAAAAGGIAAYVGKFPFDKVGGVIFDDHPVVTAGIRKTVTDAAVRKAIQDTSGPSAPIELIRGKVSAWACQQHNCGPHQWLVMVDPASGATDVCYFNEDQDAANSRWFLAGGKQEKRPGNCQVE